MCGKPVPCCLRIVHHSGRVFRTILYGWRRREKSVPLACRQTGAFRHGWISHEQDDSVHSRALDVLRERDRIFGGLGLHPRYTCPEGHRGEKPCLCVAVLAQVHLDLTVREVKLVEQPLHHVADAISRHVALGIDSISDSLRAEQPTWITHKGGVATLAAERRIIWQCDDASCIDSCKVPAELGVEAPPGSCINL